MVVGAPLAPVAFLYARSGTTWTLQAVLSAPHPSYLFYGTSVVIWGTTTLIGAVDQTFNRPGAVYVFARSGTAWPLQATLTPPSGLLDISFGYSVALNYQTAVVGGDGAVVFVDSGGTWSAPVPLVPTDQPTNGIGIAVAVQANTAIAGATGTTPPAGYVFVRSGTDGAAAEAAPRALATGLVAPARRGRR